MIKFFFINDFNDINDASIRHYSLDKGHFIAKSLAKLKYDVYFLTTKSSYIKNNIKYVSLDSITDDFLQNIDFVFIMREPMFLSILKKIPCVKNLISVPKLERIKPKFIVKSDSAMWFTGKNFLIEMESVLGIRKIKQSQNWFIEHLDYIGAQNNEFAQVAINHGIPSSMLLVSNMGIDNIKIDYDKLINPYTVNHDYCVDKPIQLGTYNALKPLYYVNNPDLLCEFNTKKHIIIYTGRIKSDGGRILHNMKNIMNILGNSFELHIFPGSFFIPHDDGTCTSHSGKDVKSLNILRTTIFKDSKNIIIHHPYEHCDKYKYIHFADCGIDFSDVRPKPVRSAAGHAKILEYCESGLPIVCEDNIHNMFIINNGKNGLIVPYIASDKEYADAIKKIVTMKIDREYCRKITVQNENWDVKTREILNQIS